MRDDLRLSIGIAKEVEKLGGATYYVGGYVRDGLLGKGNKDIDIEVYGVTPQQLRAICGKFGHVDEVGASFGVLKIYGHDIDITMPRTERATGTGHKDFDVTVDPSMDTRDAARRRDFTVNALMKDVLTGEVVDHFGGLDDLEAGRIRHVDDRTFTEDPLRVFRAAGFAARLGFSIHEGTRGLCRQIDVSALPMERVFEETNKAMLKAERPSAYFQELAGMGHLGEFFPEVEALRGVQQDPEYHPEGDAFVHTMMVVDNAAAVRGDAENAIGLMYSALYHDIGKAVATVFDERKGRWASPGHDKAGEEMVKDAMRRLTSDKRLLRYVQGMVGMHMQPHLISMSSRPRTTNRMFDKCASPRDLLVLSYCDTVGRKPVDPEMLRWWDSRLERYRDAIGRPEVTGDDLIRLGYRPGPEFSAILRQCHQIHLAEVPKEDVIKSLPSTIKGLGIKGYVPETGCEETHER